MDDTYSSNDNYYESWAYQMSKFRYNQSKNLEKEGEKIKID